MGQVFNQVFKKTAGTRRRARLSAILCVALVLGALPTAAWAGGMGPDGGAPTVAGVPGSGALAIAIPNGTSQEAPTLAANGSTSLSAAGFVGWQAVSAGQGHSLGIQGDGSLWAWGSNGSGQLGIGESGSGTDKNTPAQVGDPADRWQAVSVGQGHSLGIKNDGSLWAWGSNGFGQLGIGSSGSGTNTSTPVRVGGAADRWQAVSGGNLYSLAIKADGTLWAWGRNGEGQLGIGTSGLDTSTGTPVPVGGATGWQAVSAGNGHSLGIKDDGSLWAWGVNTSGQLGIGSTVSTSTPVQAGNPADRWQAVSTGNACALGIQADGSLWAWGSNGSGQLGTGESGSGTNTSIPVPVGEAADRWQAVSTGFSHSLGIQADGSLWAWGVNYFGQLGTGESGPGTGKSIPTLIDGPEPEGSITRVFGTDRFATAIEVSKANFEGADAVIIATGMNYADALSASALAGSEKAPLLLTRPDDLSPGVLDEVERLGAGKAYIMGSAAAVSAAVEGALAGAGLQVERIAGADRYQTSAAIAVKVAGLEGPSFAKKAFLARGDNFADGLAVSPLAYRNKMPVVLTRPAELSPSAANAILGLGIADVTILGSAAAVSEGVELAVRSLGTAPTVRRVAGATRYETAQRIAEHAFAGPLAAKGFIGVATGLNFPDALAGGAAAGERGGILVLTTPDALSGNWESYLPGAYSGTKPDIQVYGGENVVSEDVMGRLEELLL